MDYIVLGTGYRRPGGFFLFSSALLVLNGILSVIGGFRSQEAIQQVARLEPFYLV